MFSTPVSCPDIIHVSIFSKRRGAGVGNYSGACFRYTLLNSKLYVITIASVIYVQKKKSDL